MLPGVPGSVDEEEQNHKYNCFVDNKCWLENTWPGPRAALTKFKAVSHAGMHILRAKISLHMNVEYVYAWVVGLKWIEARLVADVGHLKPGDLVEVKGIGLARVQNVTRCTSIEDMYRILGPSLSGLGLIEVAEKEAWEVLCDSCSIDPNWIEKGFLILFNLEWVRA